MPEGGASISDSTANPTESRAPGTTPRAAGAPDPARAEAVLRAAPGRRTSLLVTLVLGGLTATPPLAMDMYLPSLPEVTKSLHAPAATVQLTLTACLAGMALGQLVVGPMSDRWGRRRPLLIGLAV
ncbi:MFS transporter, partial [Streptomyces griseoloalbus]